MESSRTHQMAAIVIAFLLAASAPARGMDDAETASTYRPLLTLDEAIVIALDRSPALRALEYRVRASEAEVRQARLLPNPEIEGEVENVAGSGEFSGTDAAEYTVLVSQPILLGGKRWKRVRVADLDRRLAEWTYESTKRDLIRDVAANFADVLADEEVVALSRDLARVSEELLETAKQRVRSGGASVVEQTKAEIELATSIAEQEQANQRVAASRRTLATRLGMNSAALPLLSGNLYQLQDPLSFEELKQRLTRNPDWMRWSEEIEQRKAIVASEDAQRIPDLSFGVGWRRDEGAAADAFVFAAGLPLPLFDRNQGARDAARYEQAGAVEEVRAAEQELERELAAVYSDLTQAHAQATAIQEKILPAANKAFDVSREGYLQGRFGYLDLLDAQRTLFETKGRYVEALRIHHQAVADVDRLAAGDPNINHGTPEE